MRRTYEINDVQLILLLAPFFYKEVYIGLWICFSLILFILIVKIVPIFQCFFNLFNLFNLELFIDVIPPVLMLKRRSVIKRAKYVFEQYDVKKCLNNNLMWKSCLQNNRGNIFRSFPYPLIILIFRLLRILRANFRKAAAPFRFHWTLSEPMGVKFAPKFSILTPSTSRGGTSFTTGLYS